MIHFADLPVISLQYIFGFLAGRGGLNLRITCSTMLQSSKCSEFYDKVQIYMLKVNVADLEHLQKLCDEHASNLIFNTEGCFEEPLE